MKRPEGFGGSQPSRSRAKPQRSPSALARASEEARAAKRALAAAARERRRSERHEVRRFTQRMRQRRRVVLLVLGIVGSLAAFVVVGAYSPVAALHGIEIVGASRLDVPATLAVLARHYGTPLGLVDTGGIDDDLAAFPAIHRYSLESRPPGEIVLRVVERVPIAVVATAEGFDLVDADRVVVQKVRERPADFPLVEGEAAVGGASFPVVAAVIGALPRDLVSRVDRMGAATPNDVSFVMRDPAHRIVWGGGERSDYKADVLSRVLSLYGTGGVTINVSSPDSVIVTS